MAAKLEKRVKKQEAAGGLIIATTGALPARNPGGQLHKHPVEVPGTEPSGSPLELTGAPTWGRHQSGGKPKTLSLPSLSEWNPGSI